MVVAVFPVPEVEVVVAGTTEQQIVFIEARDGVPAAPAGHAVIPCAAVDHVASRVSADEVVAVASEDNLASRPAALTMLSDVAPPRDPGDQP